MPQKPQTKDKTLYKRERSNEIFDYLNILFEIHLQTVKYKLLLFTQ